MPDERGWDVKHGNSLEKALLEGARSECRTSLEMCEALEMGVPDDRGWDVKRASSLLDMECRTSVDGM